MNNGIREILLIMQNFGLLGTYSNLLVLGTSKSEMAKELYLELKDSYNLFVDNRPDNLIRYDFVYSPTFFDLEPLLTKLHEGGIILIEIPDNTVIKTINGKFLQINKRYGILKNERNLE